MQRAGFHKEHVRCELGIVALNGGFTLAPSHATVVMLAGRLAGCRQKLGFVAIKDGECMPLNGLWINL